MSDPTLPPSSGPAPLRSHRVTIEFEVLARSQGEAEHLIGEVLPSPPQHLSTDVDRAVGDEAVHVLSWALSGYAPTSSVPSPEWAPFEDSGIPEIVAGMFPPLPAEADYLRADGLLDENDFEYAMQEWRDECLELAIQASHLPNLLERLEQFEAVQNRQNRAEDAERVRDGLIDVLARDLLPVEPRKEDYLVTIAPSFDGEIEDMRFAWDYSQWRSDFTAAALRRDRQLRGLLAEGGPRTSYLPEQFHRQWVPADLVALHTLRSITAAEHRALGFPFEREQAEVLEKLLTAADPEVRVIDPDDPAGVELYAGPASEAHDWLPPGIYDAIGAEGTGEFRLVVGRMPGSEDVTASAVFPSAEHDSRVLGEIARILEYELEGRDPMTALARINQAVTSTGRAGALLNELTGVSEPPTHLEGGVILSDLLAEREQHLEVSNDGPKPDPTQAGPERNF